MLILTGFRANPRGPKSGQGKLADLDTLAVRRPDTLCVRGVFPLFLLTQRLVAFGDINYVGETTLIVTINRIDLVEE